MYVSRITQKRRDTVARVVRDPPVPPDGGGERNPPEVLRNFYKKDCTIVCIASGPSLSQDQINIVGEAKKAKKDLFVIAVNDNWQFKYENEFVADYLYAADEAWWKTWLKKLNEAGFVGRPKFFPIGKDFAKKNGLLMIPCDHRRGLGKTGSVHCLNNSGAQAIGVSYYLGASKIILIGYDMKVSDSGKIHWFGNHPSGLRNTGNKYVSWIPNLKGLSDGLKASGVDVVNCTISTNIPESTFRRGISLEKEFLLC